MHQPPKHENKPHMAHAPPMHGAPVAQMPQQMMHEVVQESVAVEQQKPPQTEPKSLAQQVKVKKLFLFCI